VSSSDQAAAARALQMIGDITATAEVGKTYLGKVTRLADFGAFVEIIPGTDGLLHISEVAEHRINDVRDELKEGDQVLVKVLAVEGNRIKLSRKAILKEQRAKMQGSEGGGEGAAEGAGSGGGVTFEGGHERADEAEPNFNRDGERREHAGSRPGGGPHGGRGGRPGGGRGGDRGGRGGRGGPRR
jgi:polyribonucleotide nucleotidyltransferase